MTQHAAKLLTVSETAKILGISRRQVFRLLRSRRLRRIKLGERTTRISSQDVARIIAQEGHDGP